MPLPVSNLLRGTHFGDSLSAGFGYGFVFQLAGPSSALIGSSNLRSGLQQHQIGRGQ